MMQDDILAGLNPAQLEAVTMIKGPVLVLAGPGFREDTRAGAPRGLYVCAWSVSSHRDHGRHLHEQGCG